MTNDSDFNYDLNDNSIKVYFILEDWFNYIKVFVCDVNVRHHYRWENLINLFQSLLAFFNIKIKDNSKDSVQCLDHCRRLLLYMCGNELVWIVDKLDTYFIWLITLNILVLSTYLHWEMSFCSSNFTNTPLTCIEI